jgi:transposase
MPYREITMLEIKELLRLWLAGAGNKTIAARLGIDPKTVRRYVGVGREHGLSPGKEPSALTDEVVVAVTAALREVPGRPRGESWDLCHEHRAFIAGHLKNRVRLTKIRKLLHRNGVMIPYPTLYRYAVRELEFGRAGVTVPVADCGPGEEVQLDTGWMGYLEPDLFGKRRRFRAWIFTAVLSRHRFVYPVFQETTASAIEACEEAWAFFGGVFSVLIPDNTKAIVKNADPLHPRLVQGFLEYVQARGFHVDPTRVRQPTDKARVERAVPTVRDDCFGGERLQTIEQARAHARNWCLAEYGMARHSRTQRLPLEHFEAEEKPILISDN